MRDEIAVRTVRRKRRIRVAVVTLPPVLGLVAWCWSASPDTVYRILRYNVTGIHDFEIFPRRSLRASDAPFSFANMADTAHVPGAVPFENDAHVELDELLRSSETIAFLLIKHDRILFERYNGGHEASAKSLSFSMAKSVLSMLVGCAIEDGYIRSLDQPVTDFVPEMTASGYDDVSIEHLLQMTSGMDYAENDIPFGIHARFFYTARLEAEIVKLKLSEPPGRTYSYKSGEAALLGLVLSRALGVKTLTQYTQERLWHPLGMEFDGLWSIDHPGDGLERVWCCLAAAARDFAKLGRLYLRHGDWQGHQIVPRSWVEASTRVDTTSGSPWNHQYLWWLVSRDARDYYANGHLGQYLYVSPDEDVIIVRLGRSHGGYNRQDWLELFRFLAANSDARTPTGSGVTR